MYLLQASADFSWKELWMGGEEWMFLPEVVLRTLIMFPFYLSASGFLVNGALINYLYLNW